tara:strand:+ start:1071 stop:1934 length:864 start_codon:yes stop_codon:yes gene_type:complete
MSQDTSSVVLAAKGLVREYPGKGGFFGRKGPVRALKGVDLTLHEGQTLAVVGESGCGKSTLARILTLIDPATAGELVIDGDRIDIAKARPSVHLRRKVRIVFQSPYNSLNPRQKIGDAIGDELKLNTDLDAGQRRRAVVEMLERVGLLAEHANRYPHMFSGGQRQRVAIARALMVKPRVVILDEPVSALDLSVQAQVLELLAELQAEFGLSYIFISHDLGVVRRIGDTVMVMNAGEVVERGTCEQVFSSPVHPYTRQLLAATPSTDTNAIRKRVAKRQSTRAQRETS